MVAGRVTRVSRVWLQQVSSAEQGYQAEGSAAEEPGGEYKQPRSPCQRRGDDIWRWSFLMLYKLHPLSEFICLLFLRVYGVIVTSTSSFFFFLAFLFLGRLIGE